MNAVLDNDRGNWHSFYPDENNGLQEGKVKKYDMHGRVLFIVLILLILSAACGSKSTPSPTQVPTLTSPPVEESAVSLATPAEPTIAPPTQVVSTEEPPEAEGVPFALSSSEFAHEAPIPARFSCDGENISPPLAWGDPPPGAKSLALISDDPDAPGGTWVHWVLYNIPSDLRALPESISAEAELSDGSRHGENSFGRLDYGGPCPPGGTHRYFFKLYALDVMLELEPGADKEMLLQAMEGHILGETELMGTYTR
jgi:Raf kinase inhibitor-like YbhB/YbcL family protein